MATLPDTNTNIMLDMETTSVGPNPCIIELSAVHFDLNTGLEHSHFSTPISLDSCRAAGLRINTPTMRWVDENIPDILDRAVHSQIQLSDALEDFVKWVKNCHLHEQDRQRKSGRDPKFVELILWGNGAFSDNKWIEAAFYAVKLQNLMPWKFFSHHCVRTFVKQAAWIWGVDYGRTVPFKGRKHVSLDDCRHQVRYLVLARRALSGKGKEDMPEPNGMLPCEMEERAELREGMEEVVKAGPKEGDAQNPIVIEDVVAEASETARELQVDLRELIDKATTHLEELEEMAKDREEKTARQLELETTPCHTESEEIEPVQELERAQSLPEPQKDVKNCRGAAVRTGLGFGLITPETSFSDPPAHEEFALTQENVDQNLVSTQDTERYRNFDETLNSTQDTERYKDTYESCSSSQKTEVNGGFVLVPSQDTERDDNPRTRETNLARDSTPTKRRRVGEGGERPGLLSPEVSFSE